MKIFKSKKGFTLIELLVVTSIISLLASVVISNVNDARERSKIATGMQFEANILHGIGDKMIGEWRFDINGATTPDTSSYNNDGIVQGAIWMPTSGYNGKGVYKFDGTSYISVKTPENLYLSNGDFTINSWINFSPTKPKIYNIFSESGDGGEIYFNIENNKLVLNFVSVYASQKMVAGKVSKDVIVGYVPSDKWVNVAVSFSTGNKQAIFYLNGSEVDRLTIDTQLTLDNVNCANIAKRCGGYGDGYSGMIDTTRIYSSAISSAAIKQIYAEGLETYKNLALTK